MHTTNEEAAAWAENTAFRKGILDTPWIISEKDERRAKRKAEGLDERKRTREERKIRKQKAEIKRQANARECVQRKVPEEGRCMAAEEEDQKMEAARRVALEEEKRRREEARRFAVEQEIQEREEARRVAVEEEKRRSDEAERVHAEIERRDRDKKRREHERRLREQEYERLAR